MKKIIDFLVIGAAKSGTTSIHEYLRQHPMISLPKMKETHFFVYDRESEFPLTMDTAWVPPTPIDNLNDYLNEFESKEDAKYFGEACPSYMFCPYAADNIKRLAPDAKIISILRNPVDRLYSSYVFSSRHNTFDTFVTLVNDLPSLDPAHPDFTRLLHVGLYYQQLSHYYELFPRENIKIVLFEELSADPNAVMDGMMDFLGIPRFPFNTAYKFNISGKLRFSWLKKLKVTRAGLVSGLRKTLPVPLYQRIRSIGEKLILDKSETMSNATRRKLQAYYREDIQQLQTLIGRDLSFWLD